jgi:hypothetical protein
VLSDYLEAKSHPGKLARFTKILDETTSSLLPLELWDWQWALLDLMMQEKYLIILKGRQLGASWIACLLATWTAIFFPNSNVLLMSQGQDEAKKMLAKVKTLVMHLPPHLRPTIIKANDLELVFGFDYDPELREYKQMSSISALPATESAGRSKTGTIVIADEWAFHPYAEKNFASVQPTIDAGEARFIAISTANGTGNMYATTYKLAQKGEGLFKRVFLPYSLRPGRDAAWYARTQEAYKATPMQFYQEFPRDEDEAFIASGGCIFDLSVLKEWEADCRNPLVLDSVRTNYQFEALANLLDKEVRLWKAPKPGHPYVIWVDPATGSHGTDRTAIRVMDAVTKEDVAAWTGKQDEALTSSIAYLMGKAYNWAFLGVDRNGFGEAVLNMIMLDLGYPRNRIYHHRDYNQRRDQQEIAKSPGYPSSRQAQMLLYTIGRKAVAHREAITWDPRLVNELKTLVEDAETGRIGAKPPDHDDEALAFLGCLYLCEQPEAQSRMIKQAYPPKPVSKLQGRRRSAMTSGRL